MGIRRYLNFDLLLEQVGEGLYQARVTESPLDGTPRVRFRLPFDAQTLEILLLKLDPGRSGMRRVGATSHQQAAMDFGGPLFDAVFTGEVALAWQRSLDKVRAVDAEGLRLRLLLDDAPAIAGLPWELLYDARTNSFIAQSERTPVVRYLDLPNAPRPMAVDGPLRVLVVISSPIDLVELDVEAEWRRIREALEPRVKAGLVAVDRLPSATIPDLGAWLRRHQTHVVHFVGHGDFDDRMREGVVYFQDEHGRRTPVTSSVLGPYLRDHDALRMVVLNACRSARSDGVDPFGGMAQGLVQQDAAAVVAMQFPISDRAAVRFTGEFYGALVDGLPVDQAVSSARKSLMAEYGDEWSTPVLFMRSPDGTIFENLHAPDNTAPPAALTATVQPTPPTLPPPQVDSLQRHVTVAGPAWAMRVARSTAVTITLLVVAVTCVVGGGIAIVRSDDPAASASATATVVGLLTTVIALVRWMLVRRNLARGPSRSADLTNAADDLASVLTEQWRAEAANRGLVLPSPVRVQWAWSDRGRSVRFKDARQADGLGPATIPQASSTAELLTEGAIDRLHELYSRAEGGRLTILGDPGSGKTAAAILLVLQAIKHRGSLGEQRSAVPVPVLLTLSDWDPARDPLVDWAASRLLRDYPVLTRYPSVTRLAGELIRQGRVSLLLDGFDEMSPESRPRALQRLDELPGTRIVVLTRPTEYESASRAALGRVVLQLLPVDATSAAEYLVTGQPSGEAAAWHEVANEIVSQPDGVLATALSTPLMLNLVRVTYAGGAAPNELLVLARSASASEIEDRLLDRFVESAYRDIPAEPGGVSAERWLGYLASQMQRRGLRDLYWWHVAEWFPPWTLGLMAGLVLAVALVPLLAIWLVMEGDGGWWPSSESWLTVLSLFAFMFAAGLMLGLGGFGGFVVRRSGFRQAHPPTSASSRRRDARAVLVVYGFTLPPVIVLDLVQDDFGGVAELTYLLVPALIIGGFPLLLGLAFRLAGFNAGSPVALRLAWPRRADLFSGALVGASVGFLVALADRGFSTRTSELDSRTYELLVQPILFVLTGLAAGLVAGGVAGLVRAGASSFTWSTPARLWRSDIRSAVTTGMLCASFVVLVNVAFALEPRTVDTDALLILFALGSYLFAIACILTTEAARLTTVGVILRVRGNGPLRILRSLDDARARNVLRQAGPTYQFRHARLQDRLSENFDGLQVPQAPATTLSPVTTTPSD